MTAAAAFLAAAAALIASARGPGLTPDSLAYLSSGMNLERGAGLVTYAGQPLTMFPPGLSAVLAAIIRIGADPELYIRFVNAASAAVVVWVVALLLRRVVTSPAVVSLATLWLAASVALLNVSAMLLSECGFLAIVTVFLWCIGRYADRDSARPLHAVGWLLALVALAWLAFTLRYAGLVLVPVGALTIVVTARSWRAVVAAVGFVVGALIVPVLVVLRNLDADGTTMGPRSASPDSLLTTLGRFVGVLGVWLLPDPTPTVVQVVAGLLAVAAASAALFWIVLQSDMSRGEILRTTRSMTYRPLTPLVVFAVMYSGYLIAAQLVVAFDPINSRLMSPLLGPAVVVTALIVDRLFRCEPFGVGAPRRILSIAGVALVAVQAAFFVQTTLDSAMEGIDLRSDEWRNSAIMAEAARLPSSAAVYSNTPAVAWAALRLELIEQAPAKKGRRSAVQIPMSKEFLRVVDCRETYLIWSSGSDTPHLFSPDELRRYVDLTPVAEASDGTIYRLVGRGDC